MSNNSLADKLISMKPLQESYSINESKFLFESAHEKGERIEGKNGVIGIGRIYGPFQEADVRNQNGRKYPYQILESSINRDLTPLISNRQLTGELDHSDELPILKNVSHAITDLTWNNKLVMGEAILLPTPYGELATTLYRSKLKIGISARGMGSTEIDYMNEQTEVVQEDYFMITYDLVSTPSHANALPELKEKQMLVNMLKMMQEGQYKEAKKEFSSIAQDNKEMIDILFDTMNISNELKESEDFRKWFGNVYGMADIIADIKVREVLGMSLDEVIELKKKIRG